MLELVRRCTQHFTKIDQEKRKIEQICIWKPMTTGFIFKTLIYIISMEFLSLSRRRSSARNVPSGERGETDVFAGFKANILEIRSKRSCVTGGALLGVCKALRAIPRQVKERRKYYWRGILSLKTNETA